MENSIFDMDKIIGQNIAGFYDDTEPWPAPGESSLIRGFWLGEAMPPGVIRNGGTPARPWPWLLIHFQDPVLLQVKGKTVEQPAGTMMLWPPRTPHVYGASDRSWRHNWLIFDDPELPEFLKEHPLPTGTPFQLDAEPVFERYLPLLQTELELPERDPFLQRQLLHALLHELSRRVSRPETRPELLRRIEEYLRTHLREPLSAAQVAEAFRISVPRLTGLFREHRHTSPMRLLREMRLDEAARLLRLYSYSCKEVAAMTGFRDPLYFSRCFRRARGVSPRTYRETGAPDERDSGHFSRRNSQGG